MKCKVESIPILNIIELTLHDIQKDISPNTMRESIELIESQLDTIKKIEVLF